MTIAPINWTNNAALLTDLKTDEGLRLKPYVDTAGKITIGIGRNLTDVGLYEVEVMAMYWNDIAAVAHNLDIRLPWWREKPENVQRVLLNLAFNMGVATLLMFYNFLNFIEKDDYYSAAQDLKRTRWYQQVGERGPRMVARLLGTKTDVG